MIQNLKRLHNGEYTYRTAELGKAIKVHIYYSKGGINYFSGNRDSRGVYISIIPVEVKCYGKGLGTSEIQSISITQGIRACMLHCGRLSQKLIDKVAEQVDSIVPEVAASWTETNRIESIRRFTDIFKPQLMKIVKTINQEETETLAQSV